eukprot:TRINITY_DN11306_c1_g1_i1.p1 TRINITY_DN11306_c1_g1~~TRINITY_DN11306_c1_g1_i1.p1  ORF type:complete len:524 (+),score=28.68 TRINITY_DN11306_c1_g1_i1:76-1647(+)
MSGFSSLKPKLRQRLIGLNLIVPFLFGIWGFPCARGWLDLCFRLSCFGFFSGNLVGSLLNDQGRKIVSFRVAMLANSLASWIVSGMWCYGHAQWIVLMVLEHAFQVVGIYLLCGTRWQAHFIFTMVGSMGAYVMRHLIEIDSSDIECDGDCWFRKASATVSCLVGGMVFITVANFDALRRKIEALWMIIRTDTSHFEEDALQVVLKESAQKLSSDGSGSRRTSGSKSECGAASDDVGSSIDGIVLIEQIGRGAFGRVFKGNADGVTVAVKMIEWQRVDRLKEKPNLVPEFEAQLGSKMDNPFLVRTICYGTNVMSSGRETWIAQEWCDMGTLNSYCDKPRSSLETLPIIADICSGGAYMHAQEIIHGDLTSNNVLLSSSSAPKGFDCKICDFGMARVLETESPYILTTQLGTVSHMPPELFGFDRKDLKLSKKVDIYAVGVLIYQILKGAPPFDGLSAPQIVIQVSMGKSLPVPEHATGCIREVFKECISKDRSKRPHFEELSRRIQTAMENECVEQQDEQRA